MIYVLARTLVPRDTQINGFVVCCKRQAVGYLSPTITSSTAKIESCSLTSQAPSGVPVGMVPPSTPPKATSLARGKPGLDDRVETDDKAGQDDSVSATFSRVSNQFFVGLHSDEIFVAIRICEGWIAVAGCYLVIC